MPFTSREVLIPLVGSGAGGALCRVAADGHLPPHHPAHLDRSISDLLETGLYQAGQQARAAVRRLKLNGGWLRRPAPVALSIVNPGDVAGLAPDNSASAELGLALALLMYVTQSQSGTVIASGALEANSADADGPVRPVHHLRAKFDIVKKYFQQSGVASPPAFFVTPEMDVDGVPVKEKYADYAHALRVMGIEVVSPRSLRAAGSRLRALRLPQRRYEIWLRRGAITAGVLAAVTTGALWLSQRSIPINFLSVALDDGRIVQTPVQLQEKRGGSKTLMLPCRTVAGLPTYPVGGKILFKIRSGRADDWAGLFGPNYHVMVAISTATDDENRKPIVKIAALEDAIRSGDSLSYQDTVEQSIDTFFILAQRFRPFDSRWMENLQHDLHQTIDATEPAERLNAARNFLRGAAPGIREYDFQTENSREECSDG